MKRRAEPFSRLSRKVSKEHRLLDVRGRLIDPCTASAHDLVERCWLVLHAGTQHELATFPHTIAYFARAGGDLDTADAWGRTCLHLACAHRDAAGVVHALLREGARADVLTHDGLSPLMIASAAGAAPAVAALLTRECLPNQRAPRSWCTALHMAVRSGELHCAALLFRSPRVDKGALDATHRRAIDWLDNDARHAILRLMR